MTSPAWLTWLVETGHIADIAIACLVAEAAFLLARSKSSRQRRFVLFNTVSGICLMLALRTALTGGPALVLAGFLSASFAAHIGELKTRPGDR